VAGLEELSLLEGFRPWADAYDVMMPDVKYAGGLTETLRIAEQLSARGVGVSLHNPTGSVCHAVSLHVSAAVASDRPLEIQWGETPLLFDLPDPALPRPEGGASVLPPGLGHGAMLPVASLTDR
jgi:galactonate dehydratase